jgi:hypothetical protein
MQPRSITSSYVHTGRDEDHTMASLIAALRMGEGEGEPINQREAAEASARRRVNERIFPANPDDADMLTLQQLIHANQNVVGVNLTGPGRGHRPRCALGVGVRLLQCASTPDDLEKLRKYFQKSDSSEALYILPTHAPVPMFASGPPLDEKICLDRCQKVSLSYDNYWNAIDSEFKTRFEERRDEKTEDETPITVTEDSKSRRQAESLHIPVVCTESDHSQINGPEHHAFFVIAFVPEVQETIKSYKEPLLAVFGSFADEEAAEEYGKSICFSYPLLEPCVVKGGEWLYPRVLGEDGAHDIKTLFPNAAKLESLVSSLQRTTEKTAGALRKKENLPTALSEK